MGRAKKFNRAFHSSRTEIVDPKMHRKDKRRLYCHQQAVAYRALAMVPRLFRRGGISCDGGFINLVAGRMSPSQIRIS
jgi:hypothetical protein